MHFPLSPARPNKSATAGHSRSASVPCYSHPLLARLQDCIATLRAWSMSSSTSVVDMSSGLAIIEAVLAVLGELLELPQAAKALHDTAASDRLLDGFLLLADAYGTFEPALLSLKQHVAELQAATRRRDGMPLAASLRVRRHTEKQLCRLAAAMRDASRCASAVPSANAADTEVVGIVTDAAAATMAASESIFLGCAALSPAMSALVESTVSTKKWLERVGIVSAAKTTSPEAVAMALERLEELEECIGELESGSEKAFRSLVQTRVSLLNIRSPS